MWMLSNGHRGPVVKEAMATTPVFWSRLPRDPAAFGFAQANVFMDPLHMRGEGTLNHPWSRYPQPADHYFRRGSFDDYQAMMGAVPQYMMPWMPYDPPYGPRSSFPTMPVAGRRASAYVVTSSVSSRSIKPTSLRQRLECIERDVKALRADAGFVAADRPLFCASCGAKVVRRANFCVKCGCAVAKDTEKFESAKTNQVCEPAGTKRSPGVHGGSRETKRSMHSEATKIVSIQRLQSVNKGVRSQSGPRTESAGTQEGPHTTEGGTGGGVPANDGAAPGGEEERGEQHSEALREDADQQAEAERRAEAEAVLAAEAARAAEDAGRTRVAEDAAEEERAAAEAEAARRAQDEQQAKAEQEEGALDGSAGSEGKAGDGNEGAGSAADKGAQQGGAGLAANRDAGADEFGGIAEQLVGEDLGATKPWVGTLKKFKESGYDGRLPPEKDGLVAPAVTMHLDHVFGFRGISAQEGKCKVGYNGSGGVVGAVGTVGFVEAMEQGGEHDAKNRSQSHFARHKAEVTCLVTDLKGELVATGDSDCAVYVWSSEDCLMRAKLPSKGAHHKGIGAIAFSAESKYLVTIGKDSDHKMLVWEWRKEKKDECLVVQESCGHTIILDVACNPYNTSDACSFVTVGLKHVKFWEIASIDCGSRSKVKKFGGGQDTHLLSVDFIPHTSADKSQDKKGYALTGGLDSGKVVIWRASVGKPLTAVEVGNKAVTIGASMFAQHGVVLAGDQDGKISVWDAAKFGDKGASCLSSFTIADIVASVTPTERAAGFGLDGDANGRGGQQVHGAAVRSVALRKSEENPMIMMLVASGQNQVLEALIEVGGQDFSWADARPCSARLVTQGHSSLSWRGDGSRVSPTGGELWGLASHPSKSDVFATAGDDGMLRLWHADKKCLLGYLLLSQTSGTPAGARTCAFRGSDGVDIAVGLHTGEVVIVRTECVNGDTKYRLTQRAALPKLRSREITQVKFSKDGSMLAAASRENVIDLYRVQGDGDEDSGDRAYAHAATCKGHSGAVAFVDWDESGEWLQSVDTSYEILFWRVGDAGGGKELRPHTVLADVQKVLWHTMTCPVSFAGVGVMGASGAEVKGIDRDPERSMLIAANAKNELSLYRYPAVEGVECTTSGSAHCAMVTNVRFLCDGKRAVSIGGKDLSCMVWDLISPG